MRGFNKAEFIAVPDTVRNARCHELARALTTEMKTAKDFHECAASLVAELRAAGHDLWSLDESDDFEVWGPNYETPSGPGIVVTFRPDEVSVDWTAE